MRASRRAPSWLTGLALIALSGLNSMPLHAQEPETTEKGTKSIQARAQLEEAKRLYDTLDWDEALVQLHAAIEAGLDTVDLADAYWYLALCSKALGQDDAAKGYLLNVLRTNPHFNLPSTMASAPDFAALFAQASAQADRAPPTITILPLKGVRRGKPITVVAAVTDESPIVQVELSFRLSNAKQDTIVAMTKTPDGNWTGDIAGDATKRPGTLAYQVAAEDDWHNPGTREGAVTIPAQTHRGGPLVIVGGAILGVTSLVVTWIALRSKTPVWDPGPAPGPPSAP